MIKSLADLRPGDLMFGPIGGPVGAFVGLGQLILGEGFRVGKMSIRHVGVVVEAGRTLKSPSIDGTGTAFIHMAKLVQAMPSGAEEITITENTHWTPRHAYARLPEDYPGQAEDAAAIARAMIGTPYSFASYAALALWRAGLKAERLEKWIDRRQMPKLMPLPSGKGFQHDGTREDLASFKLPCEAICSVLADQAWTLAGKKVMEGVAHQCVTPGALATRLIMMRGVEWGFPR